jgi:hypothetical protein
MSEKRNEVQRQQPESKGAGLSLPDLGSIKGKFSKIVIAVIVAVILVVTACSLPFWIAGVLGYNAISSSEPAISRNDPRRNDPRTVYDPLNCASRNMWVIAWNTAEGKKYSCTPKWR